MMDFNIKRDNELIAAGTHFFCSGCFIVKPLDDKSPDERYCQGCFEFLNHEASLLPFSKRPKWIPRQLKGREKTIPVPQDGVLNMATIKDQKTKVAIIQSVAPKDTYSRRGPKQKALPVELIEEWRGQGLGSKAIATKLNSQGIDVGFRPIARILAGERLLV